MKILSEIAKFVYDELKQNPENFYIDDDYHLKHKKHKNLQLWVANGFLFLHLNNFKYTAEVKFSFLEKIILWVALCKALKMANKQYLLKIIEELKKV